MLTKNQRHKRDKLVRRHANLFNKFQLTVSRELAKKLRNLEARMRREGLC